MKLSVYLNYAGTCEAAFRFYEQHLGGRITSMMRHSELPQSGVPEEFRNGILHARIEIGGMLLMGSDIPSAQPVRSAYLSLAVDSAEEAERLYTLLAEDGEVFMAIHETFFASRFAQLRDRFGTSWQLMHERPRA
ncbi:MAG TPA: VOC family protein [Longimicrobium sp.]|uniref:VOC family protein n=1 Tax=Longimicrobium sp. TaxID=2029185 RepID=UPI002ED8A9B2